MLTLTNDPFVAFTLKELAEVQFNTLEVMVRRFALLPNNDPVVIDKQLTFVVLNELRPVKLPDKCLWGGVLD